MENNKITLVKTFHAIGGDNNNHGDCFFYGSFAGCDADCPQLRRGECEAWETNVDIIKEDEELVKAYSDKLNTLHVKE